MNARDELDAAASPFELRVDGARDVPESDVRSALATGDMGFIHSFTTGSTLDGPGVRLVAWLAGCQFRCLVLPQSRYLEHDQRHLRHSGARESATAQIPAGADER